MGVPKFFRWLSERYPKINQRYGSVPVQSTVAEHYPESFIAVDDADDSNKDSINVNINTNINTSTSNNNENSSNDTTMKKTGSLSSVGMNHESIMDSNQSTSTSSTSTSSSSSSQQRPPQSKQIYDIEHLRPDFLSTCTLPPEIDRLYIDMNGIIHGCSHANNGSGSSSKSQARAPAVIAGQSTSTTLRSVDDYDDEHNDEIITTHISEDEIFRNVCYYLDRIVNDVAQPRELIYLAIDGVAPRAKLNQQRARRYRSGKEGEIEQNIYEAHMQAVMQQQQQQQQQHDQQQQQEEEIEMNRTIVLQKSKETAPFQLDDPSRKANSNSTRSSISSSPSSTAGTPSGLAASLTTNTKQPLALGPKWTLMEIEPGRFDGKFETRVTGIDSTSAAASTGSSVYDSNNDNSSSSSSSKIVVPPSNISETISSGEADSISRFGRANPGGSSGSSGSSDSANPNTSTGTHDQQVNDEEEGDTFHSTAITPGTTYFQRCTEHIQHFILRKMSSSDEPIWSNLTVIFSGPGVPGEGEHKIMQFIRDQRALPTYNPNLRHCIMGQDGDLIMLGLVTHEPNLVLLRENVVFDWKKEQRFWDQYGIGLYLHRTKFEFLHMNVLRDYLSYEFQTSNVVEGSPFDIEHCVDDFVFLTFLVGNDFLPHIPALDIADEAFILLMSTYRQERLKWINEHNNNYNYKNNKSNNNSNSNKNLPPYLTNGGNIISGKRLEEFFTAIGSYEQMYYDNKRKSQSYDDVINVLYRSNGTNSKNSKRKVQPGTIEQIIQSKDQFDRERFRELVSNSATHLNGVQQQYLGDNEEEDDKDGIDGIDGIVNVNNNYSDTRRKQGDYQTGRENNSNNNFQAVLSSRSSYHYHHVDGIEIKRDDQLGSLLQYAVSTSDENEPGLRFDPERHGYRPPTGTSTSSTNSRMQIDDEDLKGRYYSDKFGFSPFDAEKHLALRKAYIEGLVWNLKYYYEGCVSWEWYYPYHYGPMLSDLINLDEILETISFEGKLGEPFKPFEQLLACMPPSQAHLLPVPYRHLMTDDTSPIADFYPKTLVIDMNGKRLPWEAVVLLPFIDSERLRDAVSKINQAELTEDDIERNKFTSTVVFARNPQISRSVEALNDCSPMFQAIESCSVEVVPFSSSRFQDKSPNNQKSVFKPKQIPGVESPLPGLPTLRDGSVHVVWHKKIPLNVHGMPTRYQSMLLKLMDSLPEVLPVETIAQELNGTVIYFNYPHFIEGFVTAVSNSEVEICGKECVPRMLTSNERLGRKEKVHGILKDYMMGEKLVGSGGIAIFGASDQFDDRDILIRLRPFSGIVTLPDGTKVKEYSLYEVEVPLFVTTWVPPKPDPRITGLPIRIERNPIRPIAQTNKDEASKDLAINHSGFRITLKSPTSELTNRFRQRHFSPEGREIHTICRQTSTNNVYLKSMFGYVAMNNSGLRTYYLQNYIRRLHIRPNVHGAAKYGIHTGPIPPFMKTIQSPCVRGMVLHSNAGIRKHSACIDGHHELYRRHATNNNSLFGTNFARSLISSMKHQRKLNIKPSNRILLTIGFFGLMSIFPGGGVCAMHLPDQILSFPEISANKEIFEDVPFMIQDNIHQLDYAGNHATPPPDFYHGTTTVSFVFKNGIVAAVDSRASLGSFVGSKTTQKVLPVNTHILGTMAGGAADCSFWIRKLRSEASLYELTEGRRMSVARASRLLSNALYDNRGLGLSVGTMIMGFDDVYQSTPKIYYVDNTGVRIEGKVFAVGSGSTFAFGILDNAVPSELNEDEAISLGIRAIRHATFRDASSGGFINVYVITRNGWKLVFSEDLDRLREFPV